MAKTIRIPHRFYFDHLERDLDSPRVIRTTKSHLHIDPADPALDELLDDARFYAGTPGQPGIDADTPELRGLVASARATVRAIEAEKD